MKTFFKLFSFPILFLFISIYLGYNINLSYDIVLDITPNNESLKLFLDIFQFPLNFFWKSMVIYGILIAILKFYQSDIQFHKMYELQKDNIYINNYFNIKNEFINSIENFIDNLKKSDIYQILFGTITIGEKQSLDICKSETLCKINTDYLSDIFQIWYGDLYKSKLRINKIVFDNVINDSVDLVFFSGVKKCTLRYTF